MKTFMKISKTLAFIAILGLILLFPSKASAEDIPVYINDEKIEMDVPAQIINGSTYVPLRSVFEALNVSVEWIPESKMIYLNKDEMEIVMQIDNNFAYINNRVVPLQNSPVIVGERAMVPLRFIAEALSAEVNWNEETRSVFIKTKDSGGYSTIDATNVYTLMKDDGNTYSFVSKKGDWVISIPSAYKFLETNSTTTSFSKMSESKIEIATISINDLSIYNHVNKLETFSKGLLNEIVSEYNATVESDLQSMSLNNLKYYTFTISEANSNSDIRIYKIYFVTEYDSKVFLFYMSSRDDMADTDFLSILHSFRPEQN